MRIDCRHCGKPFSLPDHWDEAVVTCPKCGGANRVDRATRLGDGAPSGLAKSGPKGTPVERRPADPRKVPAARAVPEVDEADQEDDELQLAPEEARPTIDMLLESPAPAKAGPRRPASAAPRSAPVAPAAEPGRAALKKGAPKKCANCGAELPPDGMLCVECGYHVALQRVLQGDLSDVGIDLSTGVDRWFANQLSDGESISSLLWAMHAVVAVVLIAVGLVFRPYSWIVVGPVALAYIVLGVWLTRPNGSRAGGRWLWRMILGMRRRFQWRQLSPPFAKTTRVISNERAFTDVELGELPDLTTVEVLDLEGTNVSDKALRHLQYCEKLRYLVIRDTRFTRGGVVRLQIMKPELSIWHDDWDA